MSAPVPHTPSKDAPAHEPSGLESSGLEPASLSQAGGAQVRSFPPTDGRPTAQSLSSKSSPDSPGEPILQALQSAYDPDSATTLIDLVESRWQEIEADSAALDFLLSLVAEGYVIPADFSEAVGDAIHVHEPPLLQMAGTPRDETTTTRPVRHVERPIDPAAHRPPPPAKLDFSARQDATTVDRRPMTELGPQHEIEGVTIEAKDETPWDRSKWKATGIEGMIQHYSSRQHGRSFTILEVGNMAGGNDHYYHDPALGQRWIPFNPPAPRDFSADLQAEIRRQQLLLDFVYDVGMAVYVFVATEGAGMFTGVAGMAGGQTVRVSASKVAAEGAEAAVTQARRRITGKMTQEAAEEWETAGRRYYMELAEETVGEASERIARLNGVVRATGQNHHILTNRVMSALDKHETLAGVFKRNDKRFQYPAKDIGAHNGYDQWHRDIDKEVVDWIEDEAKKSAAPKEFTHYLHDLYQQPLHRSRIPNVNLMNIEP